MRPYPTSTLILTMILWAGCSNPADNVPNAEVGPAAKQESGSAQAPAAGGQFFKFGPASASIEFVGSKVTGSHNGGFQNFAGEFTVVDGKLADTGNKIVIDMTSVWSDNDRLTGHLKAPDFFDVAQFPTATFASNSIRPSGSQTMVTGNLTLHGVTKEISFPAQITVTKEAVQVAAEFSLNRFDFDIKYSGRADDLIRKEVVLTLKIQATPGRAEFGVVEQSAQTAAASAPAGGGFGGGRRPRAN